MPFTYSHPAAVLPLFRLSSARGWRSALVVGSMAPDFARAIPFVGREFSHSLLGLFLLDLPLSLVLATITTIWLVPRSARLPGLEHLARSGSMMPVWTMLALGAFLGGATHLGWDVFTHGDQHVFHAAFLDREIAETVAGPFRVRQLAWPLHSLAGLLVLLVVIGSSLRKSTRGLASIASSPWLRIIGATLLPLSIFPIVYPIHVNTIPADLAMMMHSDKFIVRGAMVLSAVFLAASFLFETRRRRVGTTTD